MTAFSSPVPKKQPNCINNTALHFRDAGDNTSPGMQFLTDFMRVSEKGKLLTEKEVLSEIKGDCP